MQIKNGQDAINISDEQIEKLKAGAFLDELLVSEKGAKFFAEVDTELNRLAIAEATYVRAPKTLHGSILTPEQSNAIMSGKSMEYERETPTINRRYSFSKPVTARFIIRSGRSRFSIRMGSLLFGVYPYLWNRVKHSSR